MKDSFTCWLDLTHIHDDLEDVECEIDVDLYSGSGESDDPSEIEVLSIKCIDEDCPALLGQFIELTDKLEDQIIERYQSYAM